MNRKESYWHEEAPKYHWAHARMKLVAETIRDDASVHSLLDVGAGSGTLAGLLDRNVRYLGLDITGRKEADDQVPPIRFCDFDNMDSLSEVIDGSFDAVVFSGVLEYLKDWRGVFHTVTEKALRPGGLLLVSAINFPFYKTFPVKQHPAWINHFTPADIHSAIIDNHLRLDRTYPMWTGGYPWTTALSRRFARHGSSSHPKWIHWLGVNQFLFICHSEA